MKNRKILLGAFFTGLLIAGLGTGIMITEFSEFTYGGKNNIFGEETNTETFSVNVSPESSDYILLHIPYSYSLSENDNLSLTVDKNLPDDTVKIELTYIPTIYQPVRLYTNIYEDEHFTPVEIVGEGEIIKESLSGNNSLTKVNEIFVEANYNRNDVQIFMRIKDRVLEDIKNKKIYDYDNVGITKAVVKYSKNLDGKIISDLYY